MFWPNEMVSPEAAPRKAATRGARLQHAPVDLPRRREVAVGVHVAGGIELGDRIDHRARHLAAAGAVQKRELGSAAAGCQRREVAPARNESWSVNAIRAGRRRNRSPSVSHRVGAASCSLGARIFAGPAGHGEQRIAAVHERAFDGDLAALSESASRSTPSSCRRRYARNNPDRSRPRLVRRVVDFVGEHQQVADQSWSPLR